MANGNGNTAVLEFLQLAKGMDKLSAKEQNQLTAQGVMLILKMQVARDEEWVVYRKRVDDMARVVFFPRDHPYAFSVAVVLFVTLFVSDLRHPFFAALKETIAQIGFLIGL